MQESEPNPRGNRSEKTGLVISNKMQKTVVVRVDKTFRDPKYQKVVTRGRKYYAHDESNELQDGDMVVIKESRPYSKTKRWLVVKKIEGTK
jgi:small subunit ribosomal protein S17